MVYCQGVYISHHCICKFQFYFALLLRGFARQACSWLKAIRSENILRNFQTYTPAISQNKLGVFAIQ